MKQLISIIFLLLIPFIVVAQSNFSAAEYVQFLQDNKDLESQILIDRYSPTNIYYSDLSRSSALNDFAFLDSINIKYKLTVAELDLLTKNHFVVTERLNFDCFGRALHDIYKKDLPVFVTTDAILHALHASYDRILMDLEISILEKKLAESLNGLYAAYPQLLNQYISNAQLHDALRDVDLYVTIAKSLLEEQLLSPQFENRANLDKVWQAIQAEQMMMMPLFTSTVNRRLDFSQFTVRGHYTREFYDDQGIRRTLAPYFKSMMWLGRIDFLLTAPPENPWEEPWPPEEIKRMNFGAVLLNELIELADVRSALDEIDEIITFMVGESDNLTPTELKDIIETKNIGNVTVLLDDSVYQDFQATLQSSADYGQRILSNFFLMDPYDSEPGQLPISYRLMGQRFIIDSYVFSNVVFDRIVYQGNKIWRPMPDPLDAMFVLGNDDALPLLKNELDTYQYSSQLAALRYLVDAYDSEFWDMSLYNVWLQSLRSVNPSHEQSNFPLFMKTTAWHQEKLNTQLASWAQLRHDNLLYAKQSYTGGTACSFPHSFVEPYPEFYQQIAALAEKADAFFAGYSSSHWVINYLKNYFPRLQETMEKLAIIAQKELDLLPFSDEEIDFLKKMLFIDGMSGAPPFSGWYAFLYYDPEDAAKGDYIVADVHTQPTDQFGNVIGRVLHVGVGKINLGIFLADSPSNDYQPMAFVGMVMSYYEKITQDFDRLTDERWTEFVKTNQLPARPDWVNIYLIDSLGNALNNGRELPGVLYTEMPDDLPAVSNEYRLAQNYPNPFNPITTIAYSIPTKQKVKLTVFDLLGREMATLVDAEQPAGNYTIRWETHHLPSGVYFCRVRVGEFVQTIKMSLIR